MAIKKIKSDSTFKLVSSFDEAVSETSQENKDKYLETGNQSYLTIDESKNPTFFIAKNIKSDVMAAINQKYMKFDPVSKSSRIDGVGRMALEMFDEAITEMHEGDKVYKLIKPEEYAKKEKAGNADGFISKDQIPYGILTEIGSLISAKISLGDEEKK